MKFTMGERVRYNGEIMRVARPWRGQNCHACNNNSADDDDKDAAHTCWGCMEELDDELKYVLYKSDKEFSFHGNFKRESELKRMSPIGQIKVVR